MENIHISYDGEASLLPDNIERSVKEKIGAVLEKLGRSGRAISIYFCAEEEMRRLNKEYRDVDSPTDILSWSYEQDQPETPSEHALWGELALCVDVSRRQSRDRGLDLETEILRLLVHGVAHLTGKDHEKSEEDERRMLQLEIELLSSLGVVGIY